MWCFPPNIIQISYKGLKTCHLTELCMCASGVELCIACILFPGTACRLPAVVLNVIAGCGVHECPLYSRQNMLLNLYV